MTCVFLFWVGIFLFSQQLGMLLLFGGDCSVTQRVDFGYLEGVEDRAWHRQEDPLNRDHCDAVVGRGLRVMRSPMVSRQTKQQLHVLWDTANRFILWRLAPVVVTVGGLYYSKLHRSIDTAGRFLLYSGVAYCVSYIHPFLDLSSEKRLRNPSLVRLTMGYIDVDFLLVMMLFSAADYYSFVKPGIDQHTIQLNGKTVKTSVKVKVVGERQDGTAMNRAISYQLGLNIATQSKYTTKSDTNAMNLKPVLVGEIPENLNKLLNPDGAKDRYEVTVFISDKKIYKNSAVAQKNDGILNLMALITPEPVSQIDSDSSDSDSSVPAIGSGNIHVQEQLNSYQLASALRALQISAREADDATKMAEDNATIVKTLYTIPRSASTRTNDKEQQPANPFVEGNYCMFYDNPTMNINGTTQKVASLAVLLALERSCNCEQCQDVASPACKHSLIVDRTVSFDLARKIATESVMIQEKEIEGAMTAKIPGPLEKQLNPDGVEVLLMVSIFMKYPKYDDPFVLAVVHPMHAGYGRPRRGTVRVLSWQHRQYNNRNVPIENLNLSMGEKRNVMRRYLHSRIVPVESCAGQNIKIYVNNARVEKVKAVVKLAYQRNDGSLIGRALPICDVFKIIEKSLYLTHGCSWPDAKTTKLKNWNPAQMTEPFMLYGYLSEEASKILNPAGVEDTLAMIVLFTIEKAQKRFKMLALVGPRVRESELKTSERLARGPHFFVLPSEGTFLPYRDLLDISDDACAEVKRFAENNGFINNESGYDKALAVIENQKNKSHQGRNNQIDVIFLADEILRVDRDLTPKPVDPVLLRPRAPTTRHFIKPESCIKFSSMDNSKFPRKRRFTDRATGKPSVYSNITPQWLKSAVPEENYVVDIFVKVLYKKEEHTIERSASWDPKNFVKDICLESSFSEEIELSDRHKTIWLCGMPTALALKMNPVGTKPQDTFRLNMVLTDNGRFRRLLAVFAPNDSDYTNDIFALTEMWAHKPWKNLDYYSSMLSLEDRREVTAYAEQTGVITVVPRQWRNVVAHECQKTLPETLVTRQSLDGPLKTSEGGVIHTLRINNKEEKVYVVVKVASQRHCGCSINKDISEDLVERIVKKSIYTSARALWIPCKTPDDWYGLQWPINFELGEVKFTDEANLNFPMQIYGRIPSNLHVELNPRDKQEKTVVAIHMTRKKNEAKEVESHMMFMFCPLDTKKQLEILADNGQPTEECDFVFEEKDEKNKKDWKPLQHEYQDEYGAKSSFSDITQSFSGTITSPHEKMVIPYFADVSQQDIDHAHRLELDHGVRE
eukprot:GHVQ01032317.1.p1 GENE.GHVQ01032317.1~~GHVQ01032317.1.p1  ORF type:complete len:1290 (+),score=130.12 GHVQ01032317.1:105-3974(+)